MNTIDKIFEIYNSGFKPPLWIKKFNLEHCYNETICYYDYGNDITIIKELMTFREPVNIQSYRPYNSALLNQYFGYKLSIYNTKSPNIAVYCYTPVKIHSKIHNIHVLNVIGVNLNNVLQPDYQRIFENGNKEYIRMVCLVFKKIKYCFMKKKFKNLVLHGFGLGDDAKFASSLNIDPKIVFKVAFEEIFKDVNPSWGKNIFFNNLDIQVKYPVEHTQFFLNDLILHFIDQLEETLFINAWNPFSFIGNGNKNDDSLDGYFGRISAMSILGWTITNPNIRYETVNNVNIYYSKDLDHNRLQFIQNPFQLIWHHDKFIKPTQQLITQGKKHHKLFKLIQQQENDKNSNEYQELKDFLQEPYDISHLKIPTKFENKSIEWSTEMRTFDEKSSQDYTNYFIILHPNWKVYHMSLNLFYNMNNYSSHDKKKLTPYRIDNRKLLSIPFLWHPLIYTDIQGIISNKKWFEAQIHYLKNLSDDDQKLIAEYSIDPPNINTNMKKNRLEYLIENSPKLLHPMIVWRGIYNNYFKSFKIYDNAKLNTKDNKFISTSIDPKIAITNFMGDPCCLCKILLLPGTPCLFLVITAYENEREILLSRNVKFKVIDNTIKIKNPMIAGKDDMIRMYTIV